MIAVFVWSKAGFLFKDPAEIGRVVHLNVVGNFLAAQVGENEEPFGFQQQLIQNVFLDGVPRNFLMILLK
jgi:hypothetical protein